MAKDYRSMEQRSIIFIDRLTPNAVKLKLGCLFIKYPKIKLWDSDKVHNYYFWIIKYKSLRGGDVNGTIYDSRSWVEQLQMFWRRTTILKGAK